MAIIITRFGLFVVIAALIVLGVTGNLFSTSPFVILAQLLAVALAVWARTSFPAGAFRVGATPAATTVIRSGPYRLVRHPMYSAALILIWSAVLSHLGAWTLGLGVIVTTVVALRIVLEERALRQQFGDYDAYVRETRAVIPYLI